MSILPLLGIPLFGAPGLWEILIIAGVVVLIFGTAKLPKLGKGLGEGIRNFKSGIKEPKKEELPESTENKDK